MIDYTSNVSGEWHNSIYNQLVSNLTSMIIARLIKSNLVVKKNRWKDFKNEKEYFDFIKAGQFDVLMGSKYVLSSREWTLRKEFDELIKNYNCIFSSAMNSGVILKKESLKIHIHNINVKIHSPEIDEMGLEYNDEQGVYTYNVTQLLPLEFDKVEMDEFIKKERKIIDVSVDISIVTKGENIGFFIDGKK